MHNHKKLFKKIMPAIPFFVGIAGILFSIFNPFIDPGIPCIFRSFTGLLCPSCGGTRCLYYFLRFDFFCSIQYHAIYFLLFLYIIFIYFRFCIEFYTKKTITKINVVRITVVFLVLLFIYCIVRNIFPISIA